MCTRGTHLRTQKWVSPLWMLLGYLLSIQKIETIDNFYIEKVTF